MNEGWWVIELPWAKPPLNLNDRDGWQKKARLTAKVREVAAWTIKTAKVPHCERVLVQLCWVPSVKRRRDADNLVATLKAVVDGLVDAGVVDDDDDARVERLMPVIYDARRDHGRLWLDIIEKPPDRPKPTD